MDKLSFDDDFLLSFGDLFHTMKLNDFSSYMDMLSKKIQKDYTQRVSMYWYIHTDNKNEILVARHLQIDPHEIKYQKKLSWQFQNAFTNKYPFISFDEKEKLSVSYTIVEHEEFNFKCLNPDVEKVDQKYVIVHHKFEINKDIYKAFSKVEKLFPFEDKVFQIYQTAKIYISEHFTKITPIFFAFFTIVLLKRLTSVPTDSIQFQSLSFSISYTLITYAIVLLITGFLFWFIFISMGLLVGWSNKKLQMKLELYDINLEAKNNTLLISIILILLLFFFTFYNGFITDKKDPFSDVALPIYLGDTQTPSYMKIKFQDLNESKTRNVLYLYENSQNTDIM